ncbi:MAG: mitochondrial fission ELM1 family protein [Gammaproteobacteria bacterium]
MSKTGTHLRPISIWAFTDNKPGHRNQLEGLVNALAERRPLNCAWIPVDGSCRSILTRLIKLFRTQRPDFVIGAGHNTHKYLLLSRLLTGGKTIVLMKPSLPLSWFNLILIPAHDLASPTNNIITTQGVINKIKPSQNLDFTKGLFLIGGPSKHHDWDNASLALQIETIINAQPDIRWQLTTSRRTPAGFIEHLDKVKDKLKLIPHTDTDADWLPRQLSETGQVWVTEDSVSMIYEALSSGASTGLLEIPSPKPGRVQRGIKQLLNNKTLFSYSEWLKTQKITPSSIRLYEAQRCADLILAYFNHAE